MPSGKFGLKNLARSPGRSPSLTVSGSSFLDTSKHPVDYGSDVKIKVIIKRIDHIDIEKQVSASGTVPGSPSAVTRHTSHITLIHDTS